MAEVAETPKCISIILCDAIFRDERTKKLILAGTFNEISSTQFPAFHWKMCVLFTLTNGKGACNLALGIEHEKTGVQLVTLEGPAEFDNPLSIMDFNIEIQGIQFPEEGKYWVSLKADNEPLAERPFVVKKIA